MEAKDPYNKENDTSILSDLGENYYYLKTILNNRVEILKLEILQKFSGAVSFLIFSIMLFFIFMIIITLFIVAIIVYVAQITGSYLIAILTTNCILLLFVIICYFLFKQRINVLLETKILKLFNESL